MPPSVDSGVQGRWLISRACVLHGMCTGERPMSRLVGLVVSALLLGGCDLLFQIDKLHTQVDAGVGATDGRGSDPAADASSNCVVDRFDTKPPLWSTFQSPPAAAVAIDGTLAITLSRAVNAHGGIDGTVRNYTGYTIEVDIVSVPDVASEMYMDWQNGDDWYSIAVDHGSLYYGVSIGNNESSNELPYVPNDHRGFRMTHDPVGDVVHMYVRNSVGDWTLLGSVPAGIPMTALSVELAAGSYTQVASDGVARFDNFATCAGSPVPAPADAGAGK